jgi:hypothetical protein
MAVFIGGIGAAKAKPKAKAKEKKQVPVFHYELYGYEQDSTVPIKKKVKIRRSSIDSARYAMENYIIKLQKTKPGFYKFELQNVTNDGGKIRWQYL